MSDPLFNSGPATKAFSITPDDDASTYAHPITRGLYLPVSGDITVIMADDEATVTFANVAAGIVHPLRIKQVYDTGTDDITIIGLV